jgi:hypothetical protein
LTLDKFYVTDSPLEVDDLNYFVETLFNITK